MNNSDLSLSLARKQKRLLYWKKTLLDFSKKNKRTTENSELQKIKMDLQKYQQLLAALTECKSAEEYNRLEENLLALENNFNNLFSYKRLLTSKEGIPAVEENA